MTVPAPQINLFLTAKICAELRDGTGHPFFSIAQAAFAQLGCAVVLHEATDAALTASPLLPGYSLFHVTDSFHDRALDVRRVGIGPFYRMERARYRADYRMTEKPFDPSTLDLNKARNFFRIWQRLSTVAVEDPPFRDHVLVALQGRLSDHRRGQSMSPIEMIKTTMAQDPNRLIVLKPHPKEVYSAKDQAAIQALVQAGRVEIWDGALEPVLSHCAYIVTQNSSVLLKGLFYQKPAVVFADCEYHHPFHSLRRGLRPDEAFARVTARPPDFAAFAYWYLQLNSINTSRDWAAGQIIDHARGFGWEV